MNAAVARHEEAVDDPFRDLWDRIDGSTATLALSEAVIMECLRIDTREAALRIHHNQTHAAYLALLEGDADLIFVPELESGELEKIWAQRGLEAGMPALDYVPLVRQGAADGGYPPDTRYSAVYRADLPETHPARQMVEWLCSTEGQLLAREAGYVPIKEEC